MTAADASFLSSARTWAIESPALKTTLNTAGLEGAANGARSAIACAESTSALGAGSVGGNVVSRQPVPCAARREDQTATRMRAVRTASGRIDLGEGVFRYLHRAEEFVRRGGAGSAKARAMEGSSRPSGRAQWPSRPFRARITDGSACQISRGDRAREVEMESVR